MGGKSMASSAQPLADSLRIQSSSYGIPIPVVYGQTRVTADLLWYGNFVANAAATGGKGGSGGKGGGGGGKGGGSPATYSAALIMGLCEGPVPGVAEVWVGNATYTGGYFPGDIVTTTEAYNVPAGGGTYTVANSATYAAPVSVTLAAGAGLDGTVPRFLANGKEYTQRNGQYSFASGSPGAGTTATITYQYRAVTRTNPPLVQVGLSFTPGQIGQSTWAYLNSAYPGQAVPYSGIAYLSSSAYSLGQSPSLAAHSFEVVGFHARHINIYTLDVDPSLCLYDILTNTRYGARFPTQWLGDRSTWSSYCLAAQLVMSPAFTDQKKASEIVTQMADITNSAVVWSEGLLKFIPYGDTALSQLGATYTPNTTPVYDLNYDAFISAAGTPPLTVTRKAQASTYNHFRVEFLDRTNAYNVSIAEAKDFGAIQKYGLLPAPSVTAHWICDAAVARRVAQLMLQRSVYIRNQYQFKLPLNFSLLEPMDILTLTDSALGLNRKPVRVIEVEEDENDELTFTVEDFPIGTAHAAEYSFESNAGFSHGYNATPGSVNAVQFFEPPTELTTAASGLEVWAAVAGPAPSWGGCNVHVSLDGTNYRTVGQIVGPARFGTLTGPIASGNLPVVINAAQQLVSGSAADAAALSTLMWVGGANWEFLAYQTATLTSANNYTLSGLNRGAYYSNGTATHSTGDPWVRIDNSIAKSGPLTPDYIGRTIYFKFTSFNQYGGGEESLANVSAYSYNVTGTAVRFPPSPPSSPQATFEPSGVRVTWTPSTSGDVTTYEIRQGASFAAGTKIAQVKADNYFWSVQVSAVYTLWVASLDPYGNYSTAVQANVNIVSPSAVTSLQTSVVDNNVLFFWQPPSTGSLPIKNYEFRKGATWASATVIGQNGPSTFFSWFEQSAGTYVYWVAGIDLAGNYGTPASISAVVNQPPDYILRADIFSTLNGTLVNALKDSGGLVVPVDTTTTFASHFTGNSWSSPQDQINAGYPIYIEPNVATASYEEVIDYGTVLPATTIVVTQTATAVAGTVTSTPNIQYSTDGTTYFAIGSGLWSGLAPGFRYVKVHIDYAASVGANILRVTGIETKLSVKQRRDSGGPVTANSTDTQSAGPHSGNAGTWVPFNYAFISAMQPLVQPVLAPGTAIAYPVSTIIDYTGPANPTGFGVLFYDKNGTRITCSFTWQAAGY